MDEYSTSKKRRLGLAALAGLSLALVFLLGLSRAGQAEAVQSSDAGVSAGACPLLTGQIVSTPSYTYYFPIIFNNYMPPKWTLLGLDGIPIKQIAVSGGDPETIYAVLDSAQVPTTTVLYRSSDSGLTWLYSSSGISARVQSLFVHPVTPTMLLAGTLGSDGLYHSYDNGEHWTPSPIYPFVRTVAAHPATPTLWLAASYNPLNFGAAYIHRTGDAGETWQAVTPQGLIVNSFLFDPDDLNRVYACTVEGFWRSDDAGLTWYHIALSGCSDLVMHPYTSTIMYTDGNGVLKTENKGMNWTNVLTVEQGIRSVALDPMNPRLVYAASPHALFRSMDTGNSWRQVNCPVEVSFSHIIDLDVSRSGALYVATDRGVWAVSFD